MLDRMDCRDPSSSVRGFCLSTFIITVISLAGILAVINGFPMSSPPFGETMKFSSAAILNLGTKYTAEAKIDHAADHPAFDVGLFENSRILNVGEAELCLANQRVFNFGLGGTSFRQSVRMLETLEGLGRAPKTAVLSFDHVSLGYALNPAEYPGGWVDFVGIFRDLVGLSKSPVAGKADYNTQLHTPIRRLAERFGDNFKLDNIFRRLRALAYNYGLLISPASSDGSNYRRDGSTNNLRPVEAKPIQSYRPFESIDPYALLEEDIRRLGFIAANGTRVIIYESPIHPLVRDDVEERLPFIARQMRQRLFAACDSFGLTCFPAPSFVHSPTSATWADVSHPPAKLLAQWISERIAPTSSINRHCSS